mmetsp:Transcript_5168/g.8970  ORF Transcript_5168/g.8970 Transcript_5168/m.8970 type:complete len:114 (-) Transcript_5168:199-540(-)
MGRLPVGICHVQQQHGHGQRRHAVAHVVVRDLCPHPLKYRACSFEILRGQRAACVLDLPIPEAVFLIMPQCSYGKGICPAEAAVCARTGKQLVTAGTLPRLQQDVWPATSHPV